MRRADRLFQIVQILRRGRVVTAATLADRLEVSERTIYRDMCDLSRSGVPIRSEAGVGYTVIAGFDLPPMMFTEDEAEALVLGARMVRSWADPALARAAQSVLDKVEAVVPDRIRPRLRQTQLFALNFAPNDATTHALSTLRLAVRDHRKVRFAYVDVDGHASERTARPLCLSFLAPTWMLSGWCELRHDFRNFRVDRMRDARALDEPFEDEAGKTLEDFLKRVHEEQARNGR